MNEDRSINLANLANFASVGKYCSNCFCDFLNYVSFAATKFSTSIFLSFIDRNCSK